MSEISPDEYQRGRTALRITTISVFRTTRAARPALNAVPFTTPRCSLLARGNGVVPVSRSACEAGIASATVKSVVETGSYVPSNKKGFTQSSSESIDDAGVLGVRGGLERGEDERELVPDIELMVS